MVWGKTHTYNKIIWPKKLNMSYPTIGTYKAGT